MSHVVKSTVVQFSDLELLKKTLYSLGNVHENAPINIATGSGYKKTQELYLLVLESQENKHFRLGIKQGCEFYEVYYDNWGDMGQHLTALTIKLKNHYLAHHYEQQYKAQGYEVSFNENAMGAIEFEAVEGGW